MKNLIVRRNETLEIPVEYSDTGLVSARFTAAASPGYSLVLDRTVDFVNGEASIKFTPTETNAVDVGEYDFQITLIYDDGTEDIVPDPKECVDGSCDFPKLIVCASLTEGGVS